MKSDLHKIGRSVIWLSLLLAMVWACVPKPVVTAPKEGAAVATDAALFAEAERLYQAGAFDDALSLYQRYLKNYPDGSAAPAALLQTATIYFNRQDYPAAEAAYRRLLAEYPQSVAVGEARVGLLETLYRDGRYDAVMQLASVILENPLSTRQTARTYIVMGDTYVAMNFPEDAIYFYTVASKSAAPPLDAEVREKMKAAAALLDIDTINAMLGYITDDLPRSYLLFELGRRYADAEDYEQAAQTLSDFVKAYPDHESTPQAQLLLEALSEKTFYHRTTVGCLLPLSGRYQPYGERALKGVEFALSQVRQGASDAEADIKLIIKDTGSTEEQAIAAAEELVQERVAAIIGPLVAADSVATVIQEKRIPIITITQKEKVTEIGDYVFRNFLTPEMQVQRMVGYATDVLHLKTFAILYPEERYGNTFMNLFWDEVIKQGGTVVGVEDYEPSHTDFAGPIKRLVGLYYDVPEDLEHLVRRPKPKSTDGGKERGGEKDEEPAAIVDFDAIFIPDAPKTSGLLIPQLAFYDIEGVYLLGTNLWHSAKMIEMARDYVQGAIMPDGFFPGSSNPRVKAFVSSFAATYGHEPGIIEATVYDSAMILFTIVQNPEVRSRAAIKEALLSLKDYPGMTGVTSFDETGEAQKHVSLLRVYGNEFVELE